MPGKKVQCSYCSKVMRSDNLKKHVKIHEKADIDSQPLVITEQKRQRSIDNSPAAAAAKESSLESRPKNSKIQLLLDEIINNGTAAPSPPPPASHKNFEQIHIPAPPPLPLHRESMVETKKPPSAIAPLITSSRILSVS